MPKVRPRGLGGDPTASPAKAEALLALARSELREIKSDSAPQARMRLRQTANKGWLALSTAADAYLCATKGHTAKNSNDVFKVFGSLGAETDGEVRTVYNSLHIACHYEDRMSCNRDAVKAGFRLAGQAISKLARKMPKKGKKCPSPK